MHWYRGYIGIPFKQNEVSYNLHVMTQKTSAVMSASSCWQLLLFVVYLTKVTTQTTTVISPASTENEVTTRNSNHSLSGKAEMKMKQWYV